MAKTRIPFAKPSIDEGDIEAVVETLRSGWLTTAGRTKGFEEGMGAYPGARVVRESDANIDPELIERAITPRTKAIIPVHIAGEPCDMDAIMDIAWRHNLKVLEDAAHAIGPMYRGGQVRGM